MSYERKHGDLVVFKNKTAKGAQPDYNGSIRLDGKDYNLALWVKEGKQGKFMAGKVSFEKYEGGQQPQSQDDDLPF